MGIDMTDNDEKVQIEDGVTYRYSTAWIHDLEAEEHWRLYWRQQKIMQGRVKMGQHVLEIGVGSGFTANYLQSKGITVTTLDIDADKNPDIVANVVKYAFDESYDHVLAFEVLEHIPFADARQVLGKLLGACRNYLFISLPLNLRMRSLVITGVPKIGNLNLEMSTRKKKITERNHHWELEHGTHTKRAFEELLAKIGYRIEATDRHNTICFYALMPKHNSDRAVAASLDEETDQMIEHNRK
jgi:2-polyprenyl-3-methyl-5-hydroxy-6-metoxy-1,4-benzoquinol methylase